MSGVWVRMSGVWITMSDVWIRISGCGSQWAEFGSL